VLLAKVGCGLYVHNELGQTPAMNLTDNSCDGVGAAAVLHEKSTSQPTKSISVMLQVPVVLHAHQHPGPAYILRL
jgi:hypothetical protein